MSKPILLTEQEVRLVLWCIRAFDFNPRDSRARALAEKIEAQTSLTPLGDKRKAA